MYCSIWNDDFVAHNLNHCFIPWKIIQRMNIGGFIVHLWFYSRNFQWSILLATTCTFCDTAEIDGPKYCFNHSLERWKEESGRRFLWCCSNLECSNSISSQKLAVILGIFNLAIVRYFGTGSRCSWCVFTQVRYMLSRKNYIKLWFLVSWKPQAVGEEPSEEEEVQLTLVTFWKF